MTNEQDTAKDQLLEHLATVVARVDVIAQGEHLSHRVFLQALDTLASPETSNPGFPPSLSPSSTPLERALIEFRQKVLDMRKSMCLES